MTRQQILTDATKIISTDREKQYGVAESNFGLIAELWNAYLKGKTISPADVGILMCLLKIARIRSGRFSEDSYVDACGYLALAGEISTPELADPLEHARNALIEACADWGDND